MSLLTEVDNPVTGNASRASFEAVTPSSLCGLMRLHGWGAWESGHFHELSGPCKFCLFPVSYGPSPLYRLGCLNSLKKSDPKMWDIPKSVHKSLTEYLPSLHFQEGLTSHNTVDPGPLFFFSCSRLYCLGRGYESLCILQPSLRWKVCSYEKWQHFLIS